MTEDLVIHKVQISVDRERSDQKQSFTFSSHPEPRPQPQTEPQQHGIDTSEMREEWVDNMMDRVKSEEDGPIDSTGQFRTLEEAMVDSSAVLENGQTAPPFTDAEKVRTTVLAELLLKFAYDERLCPSDSNSNH
ncbi:hypothetical protein L204_100978 [Cryptococcus depauperatus]